MIGKKHLTFKRHICDKDSVDQEAFPDVARIHCRQNLDTFEERSRRKF